ncbi:uncharacterized protein LOC112095349 [Morus notabilis]|uniref:uncharacterized protein LOC112095349 n=1 Tax=Morus notabilis TaxID=981085 RepID=UPI000CED71C0|nr:uncharacterized protein LOC112095349 [Morus notabilis]
MGGTSVRTAGGYTTEFPIQIGLHQESALSPYLFTMVMDELTREIQDRYERDIEDDIQHRIKAWWVKRKNATRVLCDGKMPIKLKEKFYRTAICPVMLYGSECWAIKRQHLSKMSVTEMPLTAGIFVVIVLHHRQSFPPQAKLATNQPPSMRAIVVLVSSSWQDLPFFHRDAATNRDRKE